MSFAIQEGTRYFRNLELTEKYFNYNITEGISDRQDSLELGFYYE